jgi:cytochrome P450
MPCPGGLSSDGRRGYARTGIGQSFAYLESKMVLAHFMCAFDWEVTDPSMLQPIDFIATITLRPKPYTIRLLPRTGAP